MASPGAFPPNADLTSRMALFGRLFAQQAGLIDPSRVPAAEDIVALLRMHVPRSPELNEDAPIYEAAAYLGEWLRLTSHAGAEWISEGPGAEPHLQLTDATGAIVVLVPLVHILRTASTAGYDGLPALLEDLREEVSEPAAKVPLDALSVHPDEDRTRVVEWLAANQDVQSGTRVALWRRCRACGTPGEESLTLPHAGMDWETEAGLAAGLLSERPFTCECGGPPGETSRLLMVRRTARGPRFGDIYVTPTHTRVACWEIDGGDVVPVSVERLAHERAPAA